MQIHSSYIDTYTNTRKVTVRRRAREKEISSHKEKNEAIIQWYWTAGWPENQYHHTSSSPPPFLLLFLLLHQSPLSFHPPNFTRFPPLLLFTPLFFLFLHILLFQHHPKITRKTSPFYNKCTWEILDIHHPHVFSSVSLLCSHFIVKQEWMACPHETSMSIDLMAALDSGGRTRLEDGGAVEEWMDG